MNFPIFDNLDFCIKQYEVMSGLQSGDKLEIVKNEGRELKISPAGWLQSSYRVWSGKTASWKDTTERIKEINDLTAKSLVEIRKTSTSDLQKNYEKLEKLNISLKSASKHLLLIKDSSYANKEEAKNALDTLVKTMDSIRKTVLKPLRKELIQQISHSTRTDEQDFFELVDSELESSAKNEFNMLHEKRLKFIGDKSEISNEALILSSLMDTDKFYQISPNHEEGQLPEKLAQSLKEFSAKLSPFLSSEEAPKTLSQIKDCFGNVTDESAFVGQDVSKILQSINSKLAQLHPNGGEELNQKREVIKDLLLMTAYSPSIKNQTIRIFTPQKLFSLLKKIDKDTSMTEIFSTIDSNIYLDRKTNMYQKFFLLSHLNFEDTAIIAKIKNSPLYQTIYHSPALPDFLSHTKIHVPQTYRQTCIGTVHNLHFQQQCSTILELLTVLQETIELAQKNLRLTPQNELAKPAYKSHVGSVPTKQDYIEKVIALVKKEYAVLQERVEKLAGNAFSEKTSKEMASLTRDWNFAMQYLETVLNPHKIVIPNTQLLPDFYQLSAVLSAIATGLISYYPGEPVITARWTHAIDSAPLWNLNKKFFASATSQKELIGPSTGPEMKGVWKKIHEAGGAIWNCSSVSRRTSAGHAIFLEAVLVDGKEKFRVSDPMKADIQEYTVEELRTQIQDYDLISSF